MNSGNAKPKNDRRTVFAASTDAEKSPRGVRGFELDNGNFGPWKVQGKIGGYMK